MLCELERELNELALQRSSSDVKRQTGVVVIVAYTSTFILDVNNTSTHN